MNKSLNKMMKHQAVVFKIIVTAWFLGIGCFQFICRSNQFDLNGRIRPAFEFVEHNSNFEILKLYKIKLSIVKYTETI